MQIEKPKSGIPAWVIVMAIVLGAGILSLPFLAENSSKNKPALTVQPSAAGMGDGSVSPSKNFLKEQLEDREDTKVERKVALPDPMPEAVAKTETDQPAQSETSAVTLAEPASTLLTSFYGNVKLIGKDGEVKTEKNAKISAGDTIEVGATGEAVIQIEELYVLRLKPNSALTQEPAEVGEAYSGKKKMTYRFRLEKGSLLGTTRYRGDSLNALRLLIQDKTFDVQDSTFRVQLSEEEPWIGVLRGSVRSDVESKDQPIVIRSLEKVSISDAPLEAPLKVSEEEWGLLRETYEMNLKTAEEEALQLDLSKRAGDFFEYVFDHGTFYTEDVGYAVRDFYQDEESGEVYMDAEYDVFPSNSFVGIYVLTRDLNTRNYGGMRFEIRRKPGEGYPERFYVELKSKGQIIHRFEITGIKPDWESRQIDFFSPVSTPITEVTLVFLNENIGSGKKGYVQMRNFEMVPLTEAQKVQREQFKQAVSAGTVPSAVSRQGPRSVKQATLTEPIQKARVVTTESTAGTVPYTLDHSVKIANEVPKVVSLDDL